MLEQAVPQYDIPERQDKFAIFDAHYESDIPRVVFAEWDARRIVLVASASLARDTQHVERLKNILRPQAVKIGVGPHSPYSDVIEIAQMIHRTTADCVVALGSGSYSDAVKIAAKLAASLPPNFDVQEMEALVDQSRGTSTSLKPATAKVVLIPTTLSGGEWNGVGSCTNSKGKKQHYGLGNMRDGAADLVLCDPEIGSTTPADLYLSSGVRCIDHCVETICNLSCSQDAEREALAGLNDMIVGLSQYKAGQSEATRLEGISNAQRGSRRAMKAIVVENNPLGPSHAIGHQLGSVARVQHGVTSAILLGPTLTYCINSSDPVFQRARSCAPKVLEVFNNALGWQERDAARAVTRFCADLGLPTSLQGMTNEAQIDLIAEATLTDIWGGGEPQITTKQEVRKILDLAR